MVARERDIFIFSLKGGFYLNSLSPHVFWLHLWLVNKQSACDAGDLGSISGLGRSPGEGNSYSLQYSCLENPKDRGAW